MSLPLLNLEIEMEKVPGKWKDTGIGPKILSKQKGDKRGNVERQIQNRFLWSEKSRIKKGHSAQNQMKFLKAKFQNTMFQDKS